MTSERPTATKPESERLEPEHGFALLLVIWVLALLAVLASAVAADSGSEAVIARNRLNRAEASVLADSGVNLAILHLVDANPATRWPADGSTRTLHLPGGAVALTLQDEGGKVDLNQASLDLIDSLADELGIDPQSRSALLRGIAQRRKLFEAATDDSPAVGMLYPGVDSDAQLVARQPFADTSDLRQLAGVSDAAYRLIAPYVTVYSGAETVNPATAPRAVLLAIPGISPQSVNFYLKKRGKDRSPIEKADLAGADRYVQPASLRDVSITAVSSLANGARFTRRAIVSVSPNLRLKPYRILRWQ